MLANEPWPALEGLYEGLSEYGYSEDGNLRIEYRFAEGRPERIPDLAAQLVQLSPDVILAFGGDGTIMLDGNANAVTEEDGAADTTIKVAWADWQDMSAGKLDGMTAFMQGKLKVEGDMSNAMQLQGVLAKLRS